MDEMLLYVQEKGVVRLNVRERVETPRRGWDDNIKRVPTGIGIE